MTKAPKYQYYCPKHKDQLLFEYCPPPPKHDLGVPQTFTFADLWKCPKDGSLYFTEQCIRKEVKKG